MLPVGACDTESNGKHGTTEKTYLLNVQLGTVLGSEVIITSYRHLAARWRISVISICLSRPLAQRSLFGRSIRRGFRARGQSIRSSARGRHCNSPHPRRRGDFRPVATRGCLVCARCTVTRRLLGVRRGGLEHLMRVVVDDGAVLSRLRMLPLEGELPLADPQLFGQRLRTPLQLSELVSESSKLL
eukprot:6195223-Pleurochrysis_carterae.AAC.7